MVRRVIRYVPSASAITQYAGMTAKVIHNGASLKILGEGKAMVNSSAETAIRRHSPRR